MATPNYGYEKRQRELAKKQKKEEKARAKSLRRPGDAASDHPEDGSQPAGDTHEGAAPASNGE